MLHNCLSINEKNHLTLDNIDTVEVAGQFGTPLYLMSENQITANCQSYVDALESAYDDGLILYASKAFSCKEIYRIVSRLGMGADVVSEGELYTALKAGMSPEKLYFHGNNKSRDELVFALEVNVGHIVVDNAVELEMLNALAEQLGKKPSVLFRIKPGIDAHTHDFIKTGQIDSKFGTALENGEAYENIALTKEYPNINFVGIHCHIGSQIFDESAFLLATEVMLKFIKKIKNELDIEIKQLNLGGGFGIKYTKEDVINPIADMIKSIASKVSDTCEQLCLTPPRLLFEPGRSIVGNAGITLYTIGSVKEIKGVRTYVAVDGGMTDNPRYALYNASYSAIIANNAGAKADGLYTIAGKCCESGDLIGENIALSAPQVGDTLAVLSTGAYNYSMSSNYNRTLRPPVVLIKNGFPTVIVKRETLDDIIRNDI